MKVLKTTEEARKYMFKHLPKKRWNNALDEELFTEVINNVQNMLMCKGIKFSDNTCINGITVYYLYNPFAVMGTGNSVACTFTDRITQAVIFVDDDFMSMSDDTKSFIIGHELGHIELRHTYVIGSNRNLDFEKAADAYSCNLFGKEIGIKAIKELRSVIGFKFKEYRPRLKAIKHIV